jgi:hypothetical protein
MSYLINKLITLSLLASIAMQASALDLKLPETDFDFRQIEKDGKSIMNIEPSLKFNIQNPKHKYLLVINALDVATTIYAMENRNTLVEGNLLLPSRPTPEQLLVQKTVVLSIMKGAGLFSNLPEDQDFIDALNLITTLAVFNNLYHINKYD